MTQKVAFYLILHTNTDVTKSKCSITCTFVFLFLNGSGLKQITFIRQPYSLIVDYQGLESIMCKHGFMCVGYCAGAFYSCCRYGGECVLSAPGGGAIWPVETSAPMHPGGSEDLQGFYQDNTGGSTDHHLLRCGARPGQPERGVLQVHTVLTNRKLATQKL